MGEGRVTRGAEAGMDAGWQDLSRIPVDCKSEIAVRLTGQPPQDTLNTYQQSFLSTWFTTVHHRDM
jgi:hypothetical protein